MTKLRAYILCRFARKSSIYTPWLDRLSLEYEIVEEEPSQWSVPDNAGIVITHMHYRWEELSALRKLTESNRVPVLVLADGVLEYRNTWEHPGIPQGCVFQPVCGHKLACIGQGQARVIESWGNPGRCEVVGMPRLDHLSANAAPPVRTEGPFRLLIATANTPAFTQSQRQTLVDSLRFLVDRFERIPKVNGRPVDLNWRLTDGLSDELGLPDLPTHKLPPLHQAIDEADAVITSPSTLYLESALRNRPTAIIDYWNSPKYITPAWSITANSHVFPVLEQLADPPPHRMVFQNAALHEQLECSSAATPRLIQLIDAMIDAGQVARSNDQPIKLPARILPVKRLGFPHIPENFDLATLYPNNTAFQERDTNILKLELAAAVKRLDQLPAELARKEAYIDQLQDVLDQKEVYIQELHGRLHAANAREKALLVRVDEIHQRTIKMREYYGLEGSTPTQSTQTSENMNDQSDEPKV